MSLPPEKPMQISFLGPEDAGRKIEQSKRSCAANPWLDSFGFSREDLRSLQNAYVVKLDACPESKYALRMWLLWDYDRLWGIFHFEKTKGVFLVDPGVDTATCGYKGCQELEFTWRGVDPDDRMSAYFSDDTVMRGKIRLYPGEARLEGFFTSMTGNGGLALPVNTKECFFRAKWDLERTGVPYTLEETVALWNRCNVVARKESVRQFLSRAELAADLHRRDGGDESMTEEEDDAEYDDDLSWVSSSSEESLDIEDMDIQVFDLDGQSMNVTLRVDREDVPSVWGAYDGNFRDAFAEMLREDRRQYQ